MIPLRRLLAVYALLLSVELECARLQGQIQVDLKFFRMQTVLLCNNKTIPDEFFFQRTVATKCHEAMEACHEALNGFPAVPIFSANFHRSRFVYRLNSF